MSGLFIGLVGLELLFEMIGQDCAPEICESPSKRSEAMTNFRGRFSSNLGALDPQTGTA